MNEIKRNEIGTARRNKQRRDMRGTIKRKVDEMGNWSDWELSTAQHVLEMEQASNK